MMQFAMRAGLITGLSAALTLGVSAQGVPDLTASSIRIADTVNAFGQPITTVQGLLTNSSTEGYADVTLTVRAYDAEDAEIAEGFGVLTDACGAGLLPDYILPPNHSQPFSASLEFITSAGNPGALINRVEVSAQAQAAATPATTIPPAGITRLSDQEIIRIDWLADDMLRYAAGCPRDLFMDWRWHALDLTTNADQAIGAPGAAFVTDVLRVHLQLIDPALFANSQLSFAPNGNRLVYQDGVNRFYTAANDGTLKRLLYTGLNNRVLQNVRWLAENRFLATYFGGVGEPVLWFVADAEARPISPAPLFNRPSATMPGASSDGRRVVIGGTFDTKAGTGVTGYYLNVVTNGFFELLFEANLPGNNFPPPVPVVDPIDDVVARVYVVRPVGEQVMLQCFNRSEGVVYDLAALPAGLLRSDRSGLWLSPDETELALTANGPDGGLWLIDLSALPGCDGL